MTIPRKTPVRKAPASTREPLPPIGALVRDRETGRVGVLMALTRDTESGKHLEFNPNGQWGWLADATGLPMVPAMADLLQRGLPS